MNDLSANNNNYRGRFAPSPTGPLHVGSMLAALGSYLQAKHHGGQWLVRIEDLDPPREQKGAADLILYTLKQFGLNWDGDVVYQSQRSHFHEKALATLGNESLTFNCDCSRKSIKQSAKLGPIGFVYPGTCRNISLTHSSPTLPLVSPYALRLKTPDLNICFHDLLQGEKRQSLKNEIGDIVLKRADGLYAYHLAVVVDDYLQNITDVVRGFDLFDCTPIHIQLQTYLNYPVPNYLHLPLLVNEKNEKLSKQTKASPVDVNCIEPLLFMLLNYLNQNPPKKLKYESKEKILDWAVEHWDFRAIFIAHKSNNFINVNKDF